MLRYLRQPEVEELVGVSGTTLWRWEKAGKFPRRRRLGGNVVAWRSDEIAEWCEARPVAELGAAANGDE